MEVYKYTSYEIGLKILKEQGFRYTQPKLFNDPFDNYPSITKFNDEQFEELTKNFLRYNFIKLCRQKIIKKETGNNIFEELSKLNQSPKDFVFNYFKSNNVEKQFKELLVESINNEVGIFCLTKQKNNLQMWAHYGDSHKGILLELESKSNYYEHLIDVKYNPERPYVDLSIPDSSVEEKLKQSIDIFYTKSCDWENEQELRDIKLLKFGKIMRNEDCSELPIVVFPFEKNLIRGITFGCRVTDDKINYFIKTLNGLYENIYFEKCKLDENAFKLNIIPLIPNH